MRGWAFSLRSQLLGDERCSTAHVALRARTVGTTQDTSPRSVLPFPPLTREPNGTTKKVEHFQIGTHWHAGPLERGRNVRRRQRCRICRPLIPASTIHSLTALAASIEADPSRLWPQPCPTPLRVVRRDARGPGGVRVSLTAARDQTELAQGLSRVQTTTMAASVV